MFATDTDPGFQTQWGNLVQRIKSLESGSRISASQQGIVVPVSTTPGGGGPNPTPSLPNGPSTGVDPVTGKPLPGAPPIIIQQGVLPVTDLVVTPGALLNACFADVTWENSVFSNAVNFDVEWGTANRDGTINLEGSQRCGGNSFRIMNLQPNTEYGVQVIASNVLGQSLATPAGSYWFFETTNDGTIPPPVTASTVQVGAGATSVIVQFQPLTPEQAVDVANGAGVYDIQVSNDPTFATVIRETRTTAYVVAFNDIYPSTTAITSFTATAGPGTAVLFSDLSMTTPGQPFQVLIDSEFITFNAPTGNSATIQARNSGTSPLANGPQAHVANSKATFQTQTVWYARVAPIDTSGNQGPWATSSGGVPAGSVTDSMLVGDLNAAHITFGTMRGDRIEANSMQVSALAAGTILATTIALGAGGQFTAGSPPATGMVINSQGMTLYNAGAITASFNATTGGSTIIGGVIASGSTPPRTILSASSPSFGIQYIGGSYYYIGQGGIQFDMGSASDGQGFAGMYAHNNGPGYSSSLNLVAGGLGNNFAGLTLDNNIGVTLSSVGTTGENATGGYTSGWGAGMTFEGPGFAYFGMQIQSYAILAFGELAIARQSDNPANSVPSGGTRAHFEHNGGQISLINDVPGDGSDIAGYTNLGVGQLTCEAFYNYSDKKVKKNILDLGGTDSSFLYGMKAKSFIMDGDPDNVKRFGFIAQDVQSLAPDLIQVSKKEGDSTLGMDYIGLIAPMVLEIQNLNARLKILEKK